MNELIKLFVNQNVAHLFVFISTRTKLFESFYITIPNRYLISWRTALIF